MTDNQGCETPMSDHVASFWRLLATEHVRILIDIRRDHDEGQPPHWDSSSFPNDVAKALVAERDALVKALEVLLAEATSFSVSGVYFDEDCMGHKGPALASAILSRVGTGKLT